MADTSSARLSFEIPDRRLKADDPLSERAIEGTKPFIKDK
jgi:hypothetical protein